MLTLTLTRSELVSHGACSPALPLFDKLFPSGRMEIEWTPLAAVWSAVAFPEYTSWLREKNLIPIANLYSADLYSADLRSVSLKGAKCGVTDSSLPGKWEVSSFDKEILICVSS